MCLLRTWPYMADVKCWIAALWMATVPVHLLLPCRLYVYTPLQIECPLHRGLSIYDMLIHTLYLLYMCVSTWCCALIPFYLHQRHPCVFCVSPSVGLHPACSSHPTHQFNLNYAPTSHLHPKLSSMAYIFPPWWIARAECLAEQLIDQ